MDPLKIKLLSEIMSHLDNIQASDLKDLVDQSKMPAMPEEPSEMDKEGSPSEEMAESPDKEMMEEKPKGISVEKVSLMGKKPEDDMGMKDGMPDDSEMSDDELDELMKRMKLG